MRYIIPILLLLGGLLHEGAANTDLDECKAKNLAFQIGEQITYKVYYKWGGVWVSAGEVDFKVETGHMKKTECYHITAYGATYRSYDWFYKVRDKYETYVDKATLLPVRFFRDVYEGGYTIYEDITFYQQKNEAVEIKDDKDPATYDIPDCTQDVLSAIYKSRCINFSKYDYNDTIPITIFLDQEVYPLYIRYIGKEVINTKFGKIRCVKFRPLLIEGTIFEGGEEMVVYATDDKNHIPLRVRSPIVVGEVRAEIKSYEGLRYKKNSLLE
jgi:Zn-finger nucleic acid-binding protein